MSNNYNSNQLDRLVNEIEGRLNDFDTGITDKDETIKSFAELIIKCAETAVNSIPMQAGVKPDACEHNFQIARRDYYKPDGGQNTFGRTYDQSRTYSTLFCTKCGETKEIITS